MNIHALEFGPDYVRAIAPYVGGRPIAEVAREFGLDPAKIIKLASNENPWACRLQRVTRSKMQ